MTVKQTPMDIWIIDKKYTDKQTKNQRKERKNKIKMNFSSGSERVTEQPSTNLLLQFDGNSAQNPEPNT